MVRLFFILITLFLAQGCHSIQSVVRNDESLEQGQVSVINKTSEKQVIFIGEDASELFPVEIEPEDTWISHEFRLRPRIRILAGEKYEEYVLTPGKPYLLYLDQKKNRPDIKMIITR